VLGEFLGDAGVDEGEVGGYFRGGDEGEEGVEAVGFGPDEEGDEGGLDDLFGVRSDSGEYVD
jgi:hypothetical protein